MDVVYILGTGTAWNNNELRYSLRSLSKYLQGIDRIFIVGHKPDFIDFKKNGPIPLIHIEHQDDVSYTKERRIMEKVKFTCQQEQISDQFFFMNDDMFLLSDCHTQTFPNYYKGTLLNSANKRLNDRYKRALMSCHTVLYIAKLNQLNFDTHAPIVYNKRSFLYAMSLYNWDQSFAKDGYVVKSLYANTMKIDGVFQPDCKIDEPMMPMRIWDKIVDRQFFSVGDNGLTDHMKKILEELYPFAALWEK